MVQKDRNIKVTGERREQIGDPVDVDLLVRMAQRQATASDSGADLDSPGELSLNAPRPDNPE
jgi:hypothetical protein